MLANVALPAFLPHSFATLIGILVIAAIEGWFVMRALDLPFAKSYRLSIFANWMSTIAGIPLAWLLWMLGLVPVSMGVSALGLQSHPLVATSFLQTAHSGGFIPNEWSQVGSAVAWLILLVPFLFGSIWIERRTIAKRLPDCDRSKISKAVIRGNLVTYGGFLLIGTFALSAALAELPAQKQKFEDFRNHSQQEAPTIQPTDQSQE